MNAELQQHIGHRRREAALWELGRTFHEQRDVVGSDFITNTVEHLTVDHVFVFNVSKRTKLD